MRYIEIQIGGELRGLKFNQLCYRTFYDKIDLEDYEGTFYYSAVWAALKANAYVKKKEFTEEWETVCDWVDLISREDKKKINEAFENSEVYKNLVADGKEDQDNKPAKKKISKSTMMTV